MPISFSAEKTPPVPVLPIQISFPSQPPTSAVISALVDTGSDFSLIPLRYLLPIDAPEMRSAFVRGLFGERQLVTLYLVDIHLEIGVLAGVEVIGVDDALYEFDGEEIILGRNILNKLYLLLDGPHLEVHLLERLPRRF